MRPRPGPPLRLQHRPAGRGRDVTAASSPPAAGTRRARLKRHRPAAAAGAPDPAPGPAPAGRAPRRAAGLGAKAPGAGPLPPPWARGTLATEGPPAPLKDVKILFYHRVVLKMDIFTLSANTLPRPESSLLFSFLIVKGMNSSRPTPKSAVCPGRCARLWGRTRWPCRQLRHRIPLCT